MYTRFNGRDCSITLPVRVECNGDRCTVEGVVQADIAFSEHGPTITGYPPGYRVRITVRVDGLDFYIERWDCFCEYSRKGYLCKHVASLYNAVLDRRYTIHATRAYRVEGGDP